LYLPKLTGGWYEIWEYYGLRGDHVVYFHYAGNNCFRILVFKGKSTSSSVNKCYDRIQNRAPVIDGPYVHFTVILSHY